MFIVQLKTVPADLTIQIIPCRQSLYWNDFQLKYDFTTFQ